MGNTPAQRGWHAATILVSGRRAPIAKAEFLFQGLLYGTITAAKSGRRHRTNPRISPGGGPLSAEDTFSEQGRTTTTPTGPGTTKRKRGPKLEPDRTARQGRSSRRRRDFRIRAEMKPGYEDPEPWFAMRSASFLFSFFSRATPGPKRTHSVRRQRQRYGATHVLDFLTFTGRNGPVLDGTAATAPTWPRPGGPPKR